LCVAVSGGKKKPLKQPKKDDKEVDEVGTLVSLILMLISRKIVIECSVTCSYLSNDVMYLSMSVCLGHLSAGLCKVFD